ncbi:hypothetical protein STCU_03261 [Strigomonas culicis]|uniref:Uncharacterized protein n=1 Tax=Strigomonas culicis TaxID=28005 RepID=S9USJ1_9TRYP|nr:hypothetical protein STCU_03261 [Strigomonas culicis]|eukprot:EPY31764.1 hypothetical protein STCU_03261 [Strigomonas culicis]
MLTNPTLLGAGTQVVVFYDPASPSESAIKLQADRGAESIFYIGICLSVFIAYRSVRCETILPNMFYRFLGSNRRVTSISGLRQARTHAKQKMKYGKHTGAL